MNVLLVFVAASLTAQAELVSHADLEARLSLLTKRVGETILVGAVGTSAERAAGKAGEKVRVIRVPTIGNSAVEMKGALERSGLRCGVRLQEGSGSSWDLELHGDCRSAAAIAAEDEQEPPPISDAEAPVVFLTPQPPAAPPGLDPAELWAVARARGTAPDPTVAFLESMVLGFGTGHFYSGNRREGFVHLGTQAGFLALAGLGYLAFSKTYPTVPERTMGVGSMLVGGTGFVAARTVDVYRAPLSARDETYRRLKGR